MCARVMLTGHYGSLPSLSPTFLILLAFMISGNHGNNVVLHVMLLYTAVVGTVYALYFFVDLR